MPDNFDLSLILSASILLVSLSYAVWKFVHVKMNKTDLQLAYIELSRSELFCRVDDHKKNPGAERFGATVSGVLRDNNRDVLETYLARQISFNFMFFFFLLLVVFSFVVLLNDPILYYPIGLTVIFALMIGTHGTAIEKANDSAWILPVGLDHDPVRSGSSGRSR